MLSFMRIVGAMIIKIIQMLSSLKTQLCEAIYHLVMVGLKQFKSEEVEDQLRKDYKYSGTKIILRITIKSLHLTFEMRSMEETFLLPQPLKLKSFVRAQTEMVSL